MLQLNPAVVPVWRDATTVQFGLGRARPLMLTGVGPATAAVLGSLDGLHGPESLRAVARQAGGDDTTVEQLLRTLGQAGLLEDLAGSGIPERLTPDAASATLVHPRGDGGAATMAARRDAWVVVAGGGRVGSVVSGLLASAGVGHVVVDDPRAVRAADLAPGGADPSCVGMSRERAAERLLDRCGGFTSPDPPDGRTDADVVVLAPERDTARLEAARLMRDGVPHVWAAVVEACGIVGPFVVPGRTSCLRCHDLHRTDRDRAWPRILDQLGVLAPGTPACDVVLAGLVAAQAAMQVLAFLDGRTPGCVDATIETELPSGLSRRRSWRPHPACGCRWDEDETMSP